MHVFGGLCTGKVTLSYWMLQNTGQNVQEIDATKCIDVILKNAQCPIDQRTKAISAVQSSWQTTRVTLIHTILTKIQSSFFQFMWYSLSFNGERTLSWWLNDKMTMSKEATPRTQRKNRNHQLKGNHVKMQKRTERLWRNLKKIMR